MLAHIEHAKDQLALTKGYRNGIPLLNIIGCLGDLAVYGDMPRIARIVCHGAPLNNAGDLKVFIKSHCIVILCPIFRVYVFIILCFGVRFNTASAAKAHFTICSHFLMLDAIPYLIKLCHRHLVWMPPLFFSLALHHLKAIDKLIHSVGQRQLAVNPGLAGKTRDS